ncbi:hypothetical protein UT300007_01670 [Clostridium sp. CTA-7]
MKEKFIKVLKNRVVIGIICFIFGGIIFSNSSKISELQQSVDTLSSEISDKNNSINDLQAKVDEAEPWFNMKADEKKVEKERLAKEEAAKKAEAEKLAKEEEAKKANKIGERIVFKYGSKGEFALTINSVQLTSERNQFADQVKNVVEINYTVENISMGELDFFLDNQAEFYDSNGTKCRTYPNSKGAGTYDIGKGRNATGKEFIAITNSDSTYLEMELGGTIYKWSL